MHETITEIREALGMNKAQFAAALDCSPAMATRLENGERAPGPEITRRLWEITPENLRQSLEDAVLRASGVPVAYVTGARRDV